MALTESNSFGSLLKQLRKRAGMTQRDLAAALNCSDSLVSSLENAQGRPDLEAVITTFIPALGLQDDPAAAALLVERAAAARGERPPASITLERVGRVTVQDEFNGQAGVLPSPPTELIGRKEEVNQLCNRLLGHNGRLLSLVGPPGIGKTRLALALAGHLQHYYADGAVFVPLADLTDPVLMASTIIAAVGGRDAGTKPPKVQLIEQLRRKSMLLVLDNLEQIREAASLLAELLSSCTKLVILATSRERLHLRAEQRYRVPPLQLADAVELFDRRAAAVETSFKLTVENRSTVEAICQRLDFLPLAIELCAAQVDLLSLPQLFAYLQERGLDLLVDGTHDLPPRQRTLRLAIQGSYQLLMEDERTLFRSLGVFAGGFALPELEAMMASAIESSTSENPPVVSALLSTLHGLVGKSLVRAETLPFGEQRFVLLEMIREFAVEKLRAYDEERLMRECHFATYLQLFRTSDSHLRTQEDKAWLARLEPELGNLRSALQWAITASRYTDAAWLMLAISYFWNRSSYGYEEARWLSYLLPYRQMLAVDLRLAILLTFYRSAFALEEFQPMDRFMLEIMSLLEDCPYKLLHATAWCYRSWTTSGGSQAATILERGIGLARAASESPGLGVEFGAFGDHNSVLAAHLWGYAVFLIDQGELTRAVPIAEESLQLFQAQGNRTGIGEGLGILGRLAFLQGDVARAQRLFQQVVTFAVTLNYTAMQSEWQALLALTILYSGDTSEARRLLFDSLRRSLEQKNTILLAQICTCLAEVALWEGELDQAADWLAQSLGYRADPYRITMHKIAQIFLAGRLATAQQHYLRAATLFGLADQAHSRIHYAIAGPVRVLAETALAKVREALTDEVFADAFVSGQQLSLEEAFAIMLAPNHDRSSLKPSMPD